jgi:hypothetical protein
MAMMIVAFNLPSFIKKLFFYPGFVDTQSSTLANYLFSVAREFSMGNSQITVFKQSLISTLFDFSFAIKIRLKTDRCVKQQASVFVSGRTQSYRRIPGQHHDYLHKLLRSGSNSNIEQFPV